MNLSPRHADLLVTGAGGFVGRQLITRLALAYPKAEIVGTDLQASTDDGGRSTNVALDITDRQAVRELIARHRPALVFHLAAQSHVPTSFADPVLTWNVNLMGTLHLLEAVKAVRPDARFVFVGSAESYGREFLKGVALREDSGFSPMNPYAASKAAGDILVRQQAVDGLRTIVLRPFNHVGPGQRQDFVVSAFCSQIARIEKGLQKPVIRVGNLAARRDFLDVRDVLDAYVAVVDKGGDIPPGTVFNLSSGRTVTIREVLEDLLRLSAAVIEVQVDPEKLRPSDIPVAAGDAGAARAAFGWEPRIPWQQTLADTLDYWRSRVSGD